MSSLTGTGDHSGAFFLVSMGTPNIYAVAGLVWLAAGCSTSGTATQADFAQYATYAFGTSVAPDSENPVFSWIQFRSRVRNEIDFMLPSLGLDYAPEQPDLLVYFYAVTGVGGERPALPYRLGWHAEPFMTAGERFDSYPANTLVIDMVDTNLNELVWRGSTSISFDSEQEVYRDLSDKIRRLIRSYPRAPSEDSSER